MKPEDKQSLKDFLEDPEREVPADFLAALAPEARRDLERDRALDRNLRAALGGLGQAVDLRGPALSEKDFKAGLLAAIQKADAQDPADELAYLRKVRNRSLVKQFTDRPEYGIGAVAALFVLAFLPFVFSGTGSDAPTDAVALMESAPGSPETEALDDIPLGTAPAPEVRREAAAPAPAPAPAVEKPVAFGAPAAPAAPQANEDTAVGSAQPAAEAAAPAPAETVGAPALTEEQVALAPTFRSRSAAVPEAAGDSLLQKQKKADAPGAPSDITLDVQQRVREKVLTNKVRLAQGKEAKLKALLELDAFYKQHGQTVKRQGVQRQINALK